jgi:acetyl-CoA carboxylase biotin carboxyl carrier protein
LLVELNQTDITELTVKGEDFEFSVRRGPRISDLQSAASSLAQQVVPGVQPLPASVVAPIPSTLETTPVAPPAPSPAPQQRQLVEITSPMVGTFYRSPTPDDPPFVEIGDRVRVGQTVCIIEAMKLMNEIESEFSGEVVEILLQNAQPVEYGQVLMRVAPVTP